MKKYILVLILLLNLFQQPSNSFAETNASMYLEELSIHLMPEYTYHPLDNKKDHPPLLIGYQGSMVNQTNQPIKGDIEIPLPMKDKNFRVGYVGDYSSDYSKAYEKDYVLDQERGTISWTTSEEIQPNERYKFVIEFYTDNIEVKGLKKTLDYQFKSFVDIGLLNITLTIPETGRDIELTPAPLDDQNHGEGENTYTYLSNDVKAGETKEFHLSYERSETKPTVEMAKNPPIEKKNDSKGFVIGAFSGIGLLAAIAIALWVRRKKILKQ